MFLRKMGRRYLLLHSQRMAYGGVLQQLGRLEDARQQFASLDRWDYRRHYQLAALASLQCEHDEALSHLLPDYTWRWLLKKILEPAKRPATSLG